MQKPEGPGIAGPKAPGSMSQSYLGGAVHYWAILAVALLTKKYDGMKGQKVPDHRAKSPWVNAILAVLFIAEPSWWWPLLI